MSEDKKTKRKSAKERIILAARKLFLEHGFSNVSTDMLAAEASSSKMTIYKYFDDKTDIFRAFLETEIERFYKPQVTLPDTKSAYFEAIVDFGDNLLVYLSDPEILRFDQLMLSQASEHSQIVRLYYENSYGISYTKLEEMIAYGQQCGFIQCMESAELLSEILIHCWEGKTYRRGLYGVEAVTYPNQRAYVEKILEIVLGVEN